MLPIKILSLFFFATLSSVAAGQAICPTTPDFMNLTDSCVMCNYGNVFDPFLDTGLANTRHTLITTQDFDPYTGNKLPLIPEGDNMSIRLGNPQIGAEAEAITYNFKVEPDKALLSIKFAVVLQDPGHAHNEQSRFRIRILNEFDELVETCAEYDVSAGAGIPGFETSRSKGVAVRWRPWTAIALDLSDYINQNIKVQFITYDCNKDRMHFGYAYFTAKCLPNKLELTACSNTSDTIELSAPPFCESYTWTTGDTSASSKFIVKAGNPIAASCLITSVTGCQFTLNAYVADGVPFTTDTVIYDTICEGEPYAKNYFDLPPQYAIGTSTHTNSFYDKATCDGTLTALLNLTVIQRIRHREEAICYGEDYIGNGFTVLKPAAGMVYDTLIFPNSQGCDSIHILHLTVSPTGLSLPKTILGNPMPCSGEQETYTLPDAEFFTSFDWTVASDIPIDGINTAKIALQFTDEAVSDTLKLYAQNGCDSVSLTLPVVPKRSYYFSFMDSICTGTAYNENDFNIPRQDSAGLHIFSQKYVSQDGCDSVRSLFLNAFSSPDVEILSSKDVICEDDSVELHVVSAQNSGKAKIGDILCTDESIVTKEDFPASGKTAMGVVFWVSPDKTHGWAAALTISSAAWARVNGIVPGVTTLHLPTDNEFTWADTAGYQNTKAIRAAGNASLYPAAWAVDFDNGWFLPAVTQSRILLGNAVLLEPSYSVIGAPLIISTLFLDGLWSSTQFNSVSGDAALTSSRGGMFQSLLKSYTDQIVQIRSFRIKK